MVMSARFEIHFDPIGSLRDAAADCEASVFLESYGNTRPQLASEYGPFDAASVFIALSDAHGDVVAASRLIVPGRAGLKTLQDTSREPWLVDGYRAARLAGVDPGAALDVATIGVRRGLKGVGALASMALYHSIVMASRVNDLRYIVMIMDARARRLLNAVGCATQVLPGTGSGEYLGSKDSTPLWANVPTMLDNQRRVNPDAARLISTGVGLDGIQVPAASKFVIRNRRELLPA